MTEREQPSDDEPEEDEPELSDEDLDDVSGGSTGDGGHTGGIQY